MGETVRDSIVNLERGLLQASAGKLLGVFTTRTAGRLSFAGQLQV